jgi:O-antigen/teichoic acid export membrane protein
MGPLRFLPHSRLQRDTFLLLALQVFYKLSGLVLLVVLSRNLPAEDIGLYFFALSFAGSFAVLANLQLNAVMMRRVAADTARASAHLAPLLGFRLVGSPVYLLCVTAAAVALTGALWRVVLIVAIFTLLENIYFSFSAFFIALEKAAYNVGIGVAVEIVFLFTFLLGMWWAPSLDVLLEANLLRSLLLLGTAIIVARWRLSPLRVAWAGHFIREGIPFILTTLLALLGEKIDTLLLGFLTGYETVGHYHLALRIVFASLFVPSVAGVAFFPRLSAHGLSAENRQTILRGAGFLLALGVLAMGVGFLFASPLTGLLYGSLSGSVTPLLRSLTLLFPLSFLNLFLSSILQALHQESKVLRALAICTGAGIVANCALIPLFGAYGAVYARILSALIRLGILIWYLRHLFSQPESPTARRYEVEELTLPAAGQW